jgi:hypothetical protein
MSRFARRLGFAPPDPPRSPRAGLDGCARPARPAVTRTSSATPYATLSPGREQAPTRHLTLVALAGEARGFGHPPGGRASAVPSGLRRVGPPEGREWTAENVWTITAAAFRARTGAMPRVRYLRAEDHQADRVARAIPRRGRRAAPTESCTAGHGHAARSRGAVPVDRGLRP